MDYQWKDILLETYGHIANETHKYNESLTKNHFNISIFLELLLPKEYNGAIFKTKQALYKIVSIFLWNEI